MVIYEKQEKAFDSINIGDTKNSIISKSGIPSRIDKQGFFLNVTRHIPARILVLNVYGLKIYYCLVLRHGLLKLITEIVR